MITFRTLTLVLMFIAFTGIVIWALSRARKQDFDEAARLALDEEDQDDDTRKAGSRNTRDNGAGDLK
ncbi:MAG: cbb3-type cytochrome c oxidase subunit 3 [Gammaproteobacteria bacterium]|nr:cbb3-type cytochrome c oxidase subunit 3 [Gammaproteobacteria bacterium]